MKHIKKTLSSFMVVATAIFNLSSASFAMAEVSPISVEESVPIGESIIVEKTATTPEIPPIVDVCLLQDETGSFLDDISNLQAGTTAEDIYDTIVAASPGANFAVAGFQDYPIAPFGAPNDHVYHLHSGMSPDKQDWLDGINSLAAGGGNDIPEAQYDAIVAATGPGTFDDPIEGIQDNCGWRDSAANPGIQRILVVTTDAPFHTPDGTHQNDHALTVAALSAENITLVGLKAAGAGTELDDLATATGGSVQPLSSDGSNIASPILSGIQAVTTDVWHEVVSIDSGLTVTLTPAVHFDVPGNTAVNFTETITVDNDPALAGSTLSAVVVFYSNSYPEEGTIIGREVITIEVPDTTAPEAMCTTTVNPHGKTTPPAGNEDLPGSKGGQNEDGYYELTASDNLDENPKIYVVDSETGVEFGPFETGTKIKYTEANGAEPSMKKIGSNKGQAGAVDWHITGQGDFYTYAVDDSNNISANDTCLVPEPPK